jgi:hypothetical protein
MKVRRSSAMNLNTSSAGGTLRTCEKIRKCRAADGFLAWPRRKGGGNTRGGVADALHRPAGAFGRLSGPNNAGEKRRPTLWARAGKAIF